MYEVLDSAVEVKKILMTVKKDSAPGDDVALKTIQEMDKNGELTALIAPPSTINLVSKPLDRSESHAIV